MEAQGALPSSDIRRALYGEPGPVQYVGVDHGERSGRTLFSSTHARWSPVVKHVAPQRVRPCGATSRPKAGAFIHG